MLARTLDSKGVDCKSPTLVGTENETPFKKGMESEAVGLNRYK